MKFSKSKATIRVMFESFECLKLSGCQGYFFACFFILIS